MADSDAAAAPLLSGLKQIFTSEKYSDLVIVCGARSWNVHKSILCSQSEFFAKAFDGEFKEAHKSKIELNEDEPEVVDAMLRYLYQTDYDPMDSSEADTPSIVFDTRVFVIADKYGIEPLKTLAEKRFMNVIKHEWRSDAFAMTIQEAYQKPTVTGPLRRELVAVASAHAKELFTDPAHYKDFRNVAESAAEFSAAVATSLAVALSDNANTETYKCPDWVCDFRSKTTPQSFWCPQHGYYDGTINGR